MAFFARATSTAGLESTAPTVRPVAPLWMKIPVLLSAAWYAMILDHDVRSGAPPLKFALEGLMFIALVAIWRMQRWGVVIAAALVFVHVAFGALNPTTLWRGPLAAAAVGTMVLVPAAIVQLRKRPG